MGSASGKLLLKFSMSLINRVRLALTNDHVRHKRRVSPSGSRLSPRNAFFINEAFQHFVMMITESCIV